MKLLIKQEDLGDIKSAQWRAHCILASAISEKLTTDLVNRGYKITDLPDDEYVITEGGEKCVWVERKTVPRQPRRKCKIGLDMNEEMKSFIAEGSQQ